MPQSQEGQQVDSAAQQQDGAPEGAPRTYTQEELNEAVDRAVKARIDKQNGKHSREMSAKEEELASVSRQLSELAGRVDAYEAEKARGELVQAVAKESGVDAELLGRMAGDDDDAVRSNAEFLKAKAEAVPKNPVVLDAGSGFGATLTAEQISEIKNPVERIRARAANRGLYQ